jgi:hypothetical protein
MADRESQVVNFFETTLAGLLASGATSTTLTTAPTTDGITAINASVSSPYYLVIDPDNNANREVVLVTSSASSTLSAITRDLEGRHAIDPDHQSGTVVRMAVLAEHFSDVHDRIDADETTNATHRTDGTKHFLLVDEDDMASNSATVAASQQSVKAYVDAQTSGGVSLGLVLALS